MLLGSLLSSPARAPCSEALDVTCRGLCHNLLQAVPHILRGGGREGALWGRGLSMQTLVPKALRASASCGCATKGVGGAGQEDPPPPTHQQPSTAQVLPHPGPALRNFLRSGGERCHPWKSAVKANQAPGALPRQDRALPQWPLEGRHGSPHFAHGETKALCGLSTG